MRKTGRKVLAYGLAVAMMMSVSPVSAAAKPTLNAKTKTIAVGDKTTLSVKNTTKKATYKWTSANKKVATVTKSGVVTGQKAGTTTVTCTVKQGTKSTKLTAKITVLKLKNGGTKTVTAGETATLKVTQYKGAKYTWRSTDTSIVTVNSKGVVTGQKAGTAVVRVRVNAPETRYVAKYTIKVNTEKKVVNQTQLNKALKNKKLTSVVIDTKKAVDLTIPAGDYKNTSLTVNTPNGEITNNGVFKLIRIKMIKPNTWHENAKGNRIAVTAKNASIVVEKDGSVDAMSFNTKGADVKIRVEGTVKELKFKKENTVAVTANGTIGKVSVSAPSNIKLDGTTKESIPVVVDKTAAGAKLDTAVKVAVETAAEMDIAFQKGSEGSAVKTSDNAVEVAIDNKSDAKVDVTTPSGTQEVGAGQSGSTAGGNNAGITTPTTPSIDEDDTTTPTTPSTDEDDTKDTYTISIEKQDLELTVGGEPVKITATLKKNDTIVTGQAVTWSSSDKKVVTVDGKTDEATITAVEKGTAIVTANYQGQKATINITVNPAKEELEEIVITNSKTSIVSGTSFTLTAHKNTEDGDVLENVEWKIVSGTSVKFTSAINTNPVTLEGIGSGESIISVKVGDKQQIYTVLVEKIDKKELKMNFIAADSEALNAALSKQYSDVITASAAAIQYLQNTQIVTNNKIVDVTSASAIKISDDRILVFMFQMRSQNSDAIAIKELEPVTENVKLVSDSFGEDDPTPFECLEVTSEEVLKNPIEIKISPFDNATKENYKDTIYTVNIKDYKIEDVSKYQTK